MGFLGKLFGGKSERPSGSRPCQFCGGLVSDENAQVAFIKKFTLADFEQKIGRKASGPPRANDSNGVPMWYACTRCLDKYRKAQ